VSDHRQDLQGRLENRQDFRNDWQENRQDFLNDRRDDWQNALGDRHPWHDGWHNGYWHGNYGNYWEHMWEQHPVWSAFAVTGWALNSAGYLFGTGGYSNPYYDSGYSGEMAYDYSEPITAYCEPEPAASGSQADSSLPPGVTQDALDQFDQARAMFGQGDYKQALALANQSLKSMPNDATLHEFTALCYFALGEYRQAAVVLNAVLAVGPGWDWTTLASLYPDVDEYTAQLRKLEAYVRSNPNASDARFVLAYHYLTTNSPDAAAKQLEHVVKAVPDDAVAKQLYDMLTYKSSGEPKPKAEPAAPTGPTLAAADMAGTWKAKGPSNSAFEMALTKDGEFTWKYTKGKKEQVVKGAFAVDRNTLAMEPVAGGVMLAELTPQGGNAIDFKMIGAPADEPPLRFTR
jgi:tetratricopeptide (TPR) repeat protein